MKSAKLLEDGIKVIPIDEMKKSMSYDPMTGEFTWIEARRGMCDGSKAGHISKRGYVALVWNYTVYRAHRVAWAWVYGNSLSQVDHINGNKSDNRISNLRLANRHENGRNRKINANNTSGFKGVYFRRGLKVRSWQAMIPLNGKRISLGYFETPEKAGEAYKQAAIKYYGEFDYFTSQAKSAQQIEPQIQSCY